VVLYAHSLGGLIAAGYLLSDRPKPDLAVLSSPALDSTLPGWKKRIAAGLARVAPTASIPIGIDGSTLSRDPGVAAQTADDPFCAKTGTARFGALGPPEQRRVRGEASRGFGIPTLVLHGLDDGLVPASASAFLATAPLVERRTYPGLRHELHNEPEGPEVVEDIVTWLRQETAGGPIGLAGREMQGASGA
jgi:alpha-beta hydrolase superfamily lysophospholipase